MEEAVAQTAVSMPAWFAGVIATVIGTGALGFTAWLFRMESRVTASETALIYTKDGIERIERKIDKLIDEGRE